MIERTVDRISNEEGFRPYVYDDATGEPIVPGYTLIGHPTIWKGICLEKGRVPELPRTMPDDATEFVVRSRWRALQAKLPWIVNAEEDVQSAVLEMAYQLGLEGALSFKLMLAALERGDRETAAVNARDSDWHRNPKTHARAERVAKLIEGP